MKYNYEQKRNDYLSPPELVKKALKHFGIDEFDVDVCCSQNNIPAKLYFIEDLVDGLINNWGKINWCNPPYNECKKWIEKAFNEQILGNKTAMLIPVRTETKYWHDYILFNPKVKIEWLKKGFSFLEPETKKAMGIFKNALALVYFE